MTASVSDDTFEQEVLKASSPVIVDFWAEWCGPCKTIAPMLEELSQEFDGQVKFVKMNVDENPKTPMDYGIRGIPTLIMFKDGEVASQQVGAHPKTTLKDWISKEV
ncbi:MAG: thioredoxin [Alphaproteobacteria bacterium]|jgi:thioredoxin 1|nr:thioredoxin [Alphaproteobacteria bacterium]